MDLNSLFGNLHNYEETKDLFKDIMKDSNKDFFWPCSQERRCFVCISDSEASDQDEIPDDEY